MTVGEAKGQRLDVGEPVGVVVSPDGHSVAWSPEVKLTEEVLAGNPAASRPLLVIRSSSRPDRSLVFPGNVAISFGLSDVGRSLVLVVARGGLGPRLLLFEDGSAGPQRDLSSSLIPDSFRVRMSGSGNRVLVSSHSSFVVGETSSATQIFRGTGRSAALSSDGVKVAFVDSGLGFVVREINSGKSTRFMPWTRVAGIGGWSPDGRYVLAGAYTSFSLNKRLVIVDLADGRSCDLTTLADGDDGGYCTWIAEDLLGKR